MFDLGNLMQQAGGLQALMQGDMLGKVKEMLDGGNLDGIADLLDSEQLEQVKGMLASGQLDGFADMIGGENNLNMLKSALGISAE